MGYIEIFLKKNAGEIAKEDIEVFLSKRIEENLNLDYKDIRAYSDFDELSKDVSAFANSDGGLLILGISEERVGKGKHLKILPKEITWGSETLSKEQLEDNIIAKIRPRINELRITPIREGNSSLRVIFLLDIPQSDNPPHMASDNKYYKRLNFRRVPMEHYEVSDFFERRRKPFLYLNFELIEVQVQDSTYQFRLRLLLGNKGKTIAKYARVTASMLNLEIVKTERGKFQRINHLRRGLPAIQYDAHDSVFFPDPSRKTAIGEITLKVLDNRKPIKINYDLVAEDVNVFRDEINLSTSMLVDAKNLLEQGGQVFATK